jgi:hypothetical protein
MVSAHGTGRSTMRVERMVLNFLGGMNTIVDSEAQLKNFNLEALNSISVRVEMKPSEFAAFREWKAQYTPPPRATAVEEKPKPVGEYDQYAY